MGDNLDVSQFPVAICKIPSIRTFSINHRRFLFLHQFQSFEIHTKTVEKWTASFVQIWQISSYSVSFQCRH